MTRLQRAALLTRLIDNLREQGSWCGETHVQKAVSFLQDVAKIPTGFVFVLYKHGPFSFDLRDELTALRADELLKLEHQSPPYGPRFAPTERSEYVQEIFSKTLESYKDQVKFVADKLGKKNVGELERLATALYVTLKAEDDASVSDRVKEISRLKPHVVPESAEAAVEEVDEIIEEAERLDF